MKKLLLLMCASMGMIVANETLNEILTINIEKRLGIAVDLTGFRCIGGSISIPERKNFVAETDQDKSIALGEIIGTSPNKTAEIIKNQMRDYLVNEKQAKVIEEYFQVYDTHNEAALALLMFEENKRIVTFLKFFMSPFVLSSIQYDIIITGDKTEKQALAEIESFIKNNVKIVADLDPVNLLHKMADNIHKVIK